MDTASLARPAHHAQLRVTTSAATEFVDITDTLHRFVAAAGIDTGLLNVQTTHTTTGIVVNEGESRLHDDFHAALARLAPLGVAYRHDDLARRPDVHAVWFHHLREDRWLPGEGVAFVRVAPTPMDFGFGAVDPGTPESVPIEAVRSELRARGGAR